MVYTKLQELELELSKKDTFNLLLMDLNYKKDVALKLLAAGENLQDYLHIIEIITVEKVLMILSGNILEYLEKLDEEQLALLLEALVKTNADMVLNYCLTNISFYNVFKEYAVRFNSLFVNLDYQLIISYFVRDSAFAINNFVFQEKDYIFFINDYHINNLLLKDILLHCDDKDIIEKVIKPFFRKNVRAPEIFYLLTEDEVKLLREKKITFNKYPILDVNLSHIILSNYLSLGEEYYDILARKIFDNLDDDDFTNNLLMHSGNLECMLKIFSDERILNCLHKDYIKTMALLSTFTQKDVNMVLKYALSNSAFYDVYKTVSPSFANRLIDIDYDLIKEYLKKDTSYTLNYFQLSIEEYQRLIDEEDDEEVLYIIIECPYVEVLDNFFNNDRKALSVYNKLSRRDINELLGKGVHFPRKIINSVDFFETLKAPSFITFRNNINRIMEVYGDISLEKKVYQYYLEILRSYNPVTGNLRVFDEYLKAKDENTHPERMIDNGDLIRNYIVLQNTSEDDFPRKTNIIIDNIIIDYLFKDNIYNVWFNIREMLRYNETQEGSLLSLETMMIYQFVLNIDTISIPKKIEFFFRLKDKGIDKMYYDDFRCLKEHSYQKINDVLFRIDETSHKSLSLSIKCGVDVYDLRNREYYLFTRTLSTPFNEYSEKYYDSYSLLSNENSNAFRGNDFYYYLYGYDYLPVDRVIHVFESDAFSSDKKRGTTPFVNRIMTPNELVMMSGIYSEIQIKNKHAIDEIRIPLKPSFVIAINEITPNIIREAKRLSIPVVLINEVILTKGKMIPLIDTDYTYAYDSKMEDIRESKRKMKLL